MDIRELALSTSWNGAGVLDGWEIVRSSLALGFEAIEVEYRVREEAMDGIESAVRQGVVRVTSVHNFSPLNKDEKPSACGGDKISLASLDEKERREGVELTRRSIDVAARLGARALVLHTGDVDGIGGDYFKRLAEIGKEKGKDNYEAERIRKEVTRLRDDLMIPHLNSVTRSLMELIPHAKQSRVTLCIENRYFFHQIPIYTDIEYLLSRVNSENVKYWHDVGHGHVLEVLGFFPHIEWIEKLKPHMFGIHIHDAIFINDHIAPGYGEIDLGRIIKIVPENCLKVLEFASSVTRDEIKKGLEYLKSL
ncbi:MAG: sugar phosphate isomerase/epimerase family protein [bacterium]